MMQRIDHQEAYSPTARRTNKAESFFAASAGRDRPSSPYRRPLPGPVRSRGRVARGYRRDANGAQVGRVAELAMQNKPSVDFCGYWQRSWGGVDGKHCRKFCDRKI